MNDPTQSLTVQYKRNRFIEVPVTAAAYAAIYGHRYGSGLAADLRLGGSDAKCIGASADGNRLQRVNEGALTWSRPDARRHSRRCFIWQREQRIDGEMSWSIRSERGSDCGQLDGRLGSLMDRDGIGQRKDDHGRE
jgi:hypothetical protein